MLPSSPRELAGFIDHTLLRADATARDVETLCAEALQACFASVCVNGSRVGFARRCLGGSGVKVAAVVGFPLGAMTTRAKCLEAEGALSDGAAELDVVLALGQLKDGARDHVRRDLAEVVRVAGVAKVKAILECCLLTQDEKVLACRLAEEAGVAMVKTSTGFASGGATLEDVRLMRSTVSARVGVKASGGIRDTATALAMIEAGATRLGTSSGLALVRGLLAGGCETEWS
jgi:deoxyribose-phosphate aldolase